MRGPVFFPVVQISLRLFQALESLALQRRHLRMVDATLDFSFSIGIPHLAWKRGHTIVRQNVAIEWVQSGIVYVGRQHAFAQIIQHHQPRGAAQAAKRLLMQLGPDPRTGTERQKPYRLPAVAECQNEQPRAPVLARVGIAHHRTSPIINLGLFAWLSVDDGTRFSSSCTAQLAHIALHALVAA